MARFLTVVLGIWAAMHSYVFWRLSSVPWISAHVPAWLIGLVGGVLWSSYILARILDARGLQASVWPLEYVAANWIGFLFLLFWSLAAVDIVTLGGWAFPREAPMIRGWAAVVALLLAVIALIQASRPPVLREHEVALKGLPPERDGTVLVAVSDLHLGNLLGRTWLSRLVTRLTAMKPDLLVIAGDLVDGNVGRVEPLLEVLKQLRAPLGVWAVTGNHEFYAGLEKSVQLFRDSGFRVLRDSHEQAAPGLILAGVDDLTARDQLGMENHAVDKALGQRPAGGTIFLSHSPCQAEDAARAGAGLMLSGHTHNGQLWPFNYFVRLQYPLLAGRYDVNGMPVIVCRGTGTWGPRMRLWRPSEILRIRLRAR
ncbi:MAG TPA: metallophosphoesterase [Verrucomicrobiae bacterium]|nr:metallophosphoesterase [Verrucomicrobiae bacterium]